MKDNYIVDALRKGEDCFIEFLKSDVHECKEKLDDKIIFFITRDKKLKYTTNIQSVYGFSETSEVKCCMWCGFHPE